MESEIPTYTPEELDDLYHIIFLGLTDEERAHNGRILMDRNAYENQEALRIYLEEGIEKAKNIRWSKQIREYSEVQEVLFCEKVSVPLLVNHRLSRVVSWRLQRGR